MSMETAAFIGMGSILAYALLALLFAWRSAKKAGSREHGEMHLKPH